MLFRKLTLAVVAAAVVLPALTAGAQYYDPYRRPPPPVYDDEDDRPLPPRSWDRPPSYGYDRPRYGYEGTPIYRPRRFGDMCVTSRGECPTRPSPINAPCRCYIDGFGEKRGAVQ